jgi:hypothetical protein
LYENQTVIEMVAKNSRKQAAAEQRNMAQRELSPNVIQYTGPIERPFDKSEKDLHTVIVAQTQFISSTVGGAIATVVASTPSGAPEWSSFAAIYDEVRVLGFKNSFRPNNQYTKVTTTCRPGYAVIDRSDSTALASYSDAVQYASRKPITLENPWSIEAKMGSVEEAQFAPTGSPGNQMWLKIYFDGLTISTEYGLLETVFLVQFRGRH